MRYNNFGYETDMVLDIDDQEAQAALADDYGLRDLFCQKLEESLGLTDVKFEVALDHLSRVRITMRLEGVDFALEEVVFEMFHESEDEDSSADF